MNSNQGQIYYGLEGEKHATRFGYNILSYHSIYRITDTCDSNDHFYFFNAKVANKLANKLKIKHLN